MCYHAIFSNELERESVSLCRQVARRNHLRVGHRGEKREKSAAWLLLSLLSCWLEVPTSQLCHLAPRSTQEAVTNALQCGVSSRS